MENLGKVYFKKLLEINKRKVKGTQGGPGLNLSENVKKGLASRLQAATLEVVGEKSGGYLKRGHPAHPGKNASVNNRRGVDRKPTPDTANLPTSKGYTGIGNNYLGLKPGGKKKYKISSPLADESRCDRIFQKLQKPINPNPKLRRRSSLRDYESAKTYEICPSPAPSPNLADYHSNHSKYHLPTPNPNPNSSLSPTEKPHPKKPNPNPDFYININVNFQNLTNPNPNPFPGSPVQNFQKPDELYTFLENLKQSSIKDASFENFMVRDPVVGNKGSSLQESIELLSLLENFKDTTVYECITAFDSVENLMAGDVGSPEDLEPEGLGVGETEIPLPQPQELGPRRRFLRSQLTGSLAFQGRSVLQRYTEKIVPGKVGLKLNLLEN